MDSISHIRNNIKDFSSSLYHFNLMLDSLELYNDKLSDKILFELNNDDFIFHLNEASKHISFLSSFFKDNINILLKKEINKLKGKSSSDNLIPYADFTVDKAPIIHDNPPVQLSFEDISKEANLNGHPISPVNRRRDADLAYQGVCPFCGAPNEYIYSNNGKKNSQFKCKACKNTFAIKHHISGHSGFYCPHCDHKLQLHHDRKGYDVFVCFNPKCPYHLENVKIKNSDQRDSLLTSSNQYKTRYHYRQFKFDLDSLKSVEMHLPNAPVHLSKIHFDSQVLGLVLTYYVNYGLSARKTALILKQVHGLNISHQTIVNYATTVALLLKPFLDSYQYKIGSTLTGDETYIKVRGKNQYVFFWSDTTSRIITAYRIYPTRDTHAACQSIYDSLRHYSSIPDDLTFITDGNPVYNAAQLFFEMNGINFDLHQVIGVKNKDEVSKLYRPFKQREERLNRTYKENYHGTNGYDSLEGANLYMILYVCFFNFLRPHSALGYKTPVKTDFFDKDMLMQDCWIKLIDEANKVCLH